MTYVTTLENTNILRESTFNKRVHLKTFENATMPKRFKSKDDPKIM